jgi:hypothetical protein
MKPLVSSKWLWAVVAIVIIGAVTIALIPSRCSTRTAARIGDIILIAGCDQR